MYYVNSIFPSFQGEGNYVGALALFIRFHFCNLTCKWCDTKYTWHKKSDVYRVMDAESLQTVIKDYNKPNIIFTGGEPSMQSLDKLYVKGYKFHVESNGTFIPTKSLNFTLYDGTEFCRPPMKHEIISKFNWVISPKLTNSNQKINEESIDYWSQQDFAIFKFIIKNDNEDLVEVTEFIKKFNINPKLVYIALEGKTLESQLKSKLVETILQNNYNYSPRVHVMLWGDKRDV